MSTILQRIERAYRPLYLHGLLLDGQYRLPKADPPPIAGTAPRTRRALLATLFQLVLRPLGSGGRRGGRMSAGQHR
ncbi:hypothetical protein ACVCL0_06150 [Rhodanobacter sp. UC4450_H17]